MSVVKNVEALQIYMGADSRALAQVVMQLAAWQVARVHTVSEFASVSLMVDGSADERLRCVTVIREDGRRILRLERRLAAGGWAGDWEVT